MVLLPNPKVLFLGEPSEDVDPVTSRTVCELLRQAARKGTTILLTTHSLSLAQNVATRFVVMLDGQLAGNGPATDVDGAIGASLLRIGGTATGEESRLARLAAILTALGRATGRDQKSVFSFAGNSFSFVSVLVMQHAGLFVYLLVALVAIIPLSTNPSHMIPPSRLGSWPLGRAERWILRIASPWVNPMTWLLAGLAIAVLAGTATIGLWLFVAAIVLGGVVVPTIPSSFEHAILRRVPDFPGVLNQLIRKDLRQMLSTLDVYLAALLSGVTALLHQSGVEISAHGLMILTALVVLALSGHTLSLFGRDVPRGLSRYRLLPLRGWLSIASKDLPVLLVSLPLLVPLRPVAGVGAVLMALAIGHRSSVRARGMQLPWRFSRGASFLPTGLVQAAGIASASAIVFRHGPLLLVPCVAGWGWSVHHYGKDIDQGVA